MKLKKLIMIAITTVIALHQVFAQDLVFVFTPEERAQIQTEWMKENLQLNDSQLVKIEALNLDYALKMEKVKSINGNLSKMKAARKASEEKDEKLKKLLSEEQFEFYLNKRKELRKKAMEIAKEQKKQGGFEQRP